MGFEGHEEYQRFPHSYREQQVTANILIDVWISAVLKCNLTWGFSRFSSEMHYSNLAEW